MRRRQRPLRHAIAAVLLAALAYWPASLVAQRLNTSDQAMLVEVERQWNDAFQHKDMAFLDSVLADEFVAIYEDGSRGDKAKELALTAAFNQQVDSSRQDDFSVKVYGDTAIVWFTLNLVGPKQGVPVAVALRYVDVFVWRDGRWQCVSSHSTKVTGP